VGIKLSHQLPWLSVLGPINISFVFLAGDSAPTRGSRSAATCCKNVLMLVVSVVILSLYRL